jgi:hypothetical protein
MNFFYFFLFITLSVTRSEKITTTLKYVSIIDRTRYLEIDSNKYREYYDHGDLTGLIQSGSVELLENGCYRLSVFRINSVSDFEFDSISDEIRKDYEKYERICLADTITFMNEKYIEYKPVKEKRKLFCKKKKIIHG